jgi:hypothetical protein
MLLGAHICQHPLGVNMLTYAAMLLGARMCLNALCMLYAV